MARVGASVLKVPTGSIVRLPALGRAVPTQVDAAALTSEFALEAQWYRVLKYQCSEVIGVGTAGLLLSKRRLGRLSARHRRLLLAEVVRAEKLHKSRIRMLGTRTHKKLLGHQLEVCLDARDSRQWKEAFRRVRRRLAAKIFAVQLVKRLERMAGP